MQKKNIKRILIISGLISLLLLLYYRQGNYLVYYAKMAYHHSEVKVIELITDRSFTVNNLDIVSIGVHKKSNLQVQLEALKEYELHFKLENGRTRRLFLSSFKNIPYYSKKSINDSEFIDGVYLKNDKYYILEDSKVFIVFKDHHSYDSLFELIEKNFRN